MRARMLTRNRMGWISREPSPLSLQFVEFCGGREGALRDLPVLDVGAAIGVVSRAALRTGARVIANDIDEAALETLWGDVVECERERLEIRRGRFPGEIEFPSGSLAAVHASNVVHFLRGSELDRGFREVARWLSPGGRLFVQAATPYQAPFAAFLAEYERRRREGVEWPGWIEKISVYSSHRQLSQMPRSIHLLDDAVLAGAVGKAGLRVDRSWLYTRPDLPGQLRLDGRETAALVAVRE